METLQEMLQGSKHRKLVMNSKNVFGRSSLHVAILSEQKPATEFIAQKYPETLHIGDNVSLRESLHIFFFFLFSFYLLYTGKIIMEDLRVHTR